MKQKEFSVDKNVFDRTVLLRSSYAVSGKCYVALEVGKEGNWNVTLTAKADLAAEAFDELEGEFRNALVNEAFRDSLVEKSQSVKELIVARALFAAQGTDPMPARGLGGEGGDTEDLSFIDDELDNYLDDPLGIAVPWEERNAEKESEQDARSGDTDGEEDR